MHQPLAERYRLGSGILALGRGSAVSERVTQPVVSGPVMSTGDQVAEEGTPVSTTESSPWTLPEELLGLEDVVREGARDFVGPEADPEAMTIAMRAVAGRLQRQIRANRALAEATSH